MTTKLSELKRPRGRSFNLGISPRQNLRTAEDSSTLSTQLKKIMNVKGEFRTPGGRKDQESNMPQGSEKLEGSSKAASYCMELHQFKYARRPETQGLKTSPERIASMTRHK